MIIIFTVFLLSSTVIIQLQYYQWQCTTNDSTWELRHDEWLQSDRNLIVNICSAVKTTQAAGFEKIPKALQSNGKIKPLLFCGIKPGGTVYCEPENSKTEILMKASAQNTKITIFFSELFSPRCAFTFLWVECYMIKEKTDNSTYPLNFFFGMNVIMYLCF